MRDGHGLDGAHHRAGERDVGDHRGKLPLAHAGLRVHRRRQVWEQRGQVLDGVFVAADEHARLLLLAEVDDGSVEHLDIRDSRHGGYLAGELRRGKAQVNGVHAGFHELEQPVVAQI